MTDHEWDVRCKAAFIGLYGALRLCGSIGMDIELMLSMLKDRLRDDGCLLPDGTVVEHAARVGCKERSDDH